jgi:hypothetical protein
MARRLAAIILMEPVLDANYMTAKQSPFAWPTSQERGREGEQKFADSYIKD